MGRTAAKVGANLVLWDSAERAAKGNLGPADGSTGMIDVLYRAAHLGRIRSLDAGPGVHGERRVAQGAALPGGVEGAAGGAADAEVGHQVRLAGGAGVGGERLEVLENLRRLAFGEQVAEPAQLKLWRDEEGDDAT